MSEATQGPVRTDKPAEDLTLTGLLFPWSNGRPVLMSVPGSPYGYLPCFKLAEKLRLFMIRAKVPFESIKQIEEGREFLLSLPGTVQIAAEPYYTAEGRVRFTQLLRD